MFRPVARLTRLPRLSRWTRRPVHLVPFEVTTQLGVRVLVEPVDVDLAAAVADVHQGWRRRRAAQPAAGTMTPSNPVAVTITLARVDCVVELGGVAAVVQGLERPNRVAVDHRDVGAEPSPCERDPLTDGAEPDHVNLTAVQRQTRDRGECWPRLGTDVMAVVDEVLERDPVPVEERKGDALCSARRCSPVVVASRAPAGR